MKPGYLASPYKGELLRMNQRTSYLSNFGFGNCANFPPSSQVHALSAGDFHIVLLTTQKQLLAFGDNSYNQLNVPNIPSGKKIDCGSEHSAVLTD